MSQSGAKRTKKDKNYNSSATKKRKSGSKKSAKAESTASAWRAEARHLGKDKQYADIVVRPLIAQNDGTSPGRNNNSTVPWNPFGRVDDQGLLVVNLIPQGDGITQRRDNAIKNKSLYISGVLRCPRHVVGYNEVCQNTTTGYTVGLNCTDDNGVSVLGTQSDIRLCVVYDESPKDISGTYTVESLMKDIFAADVNGNIQPCPGTHTLTAGDDLNVAGVLENMSGQGRFHVLANERFTFPSFVVLKNAAGPSIPNDMDIIPIKRYIKLGGIGTLYKDNSNPLILGSIARGAIYAFWYCRTLCSNMTIAAPNSGTGPQLVQTTPVFEGTLRLRYEG